MSENEQKTAPEQSEGELGVPIKAGTLAAKFLERCVFDEDTGCWLWKGKMGHKRTPTFHTWGRTMTALRASWELFKGDPPTNHPIRRTCGNKLCVSPHHLTYNRPESGKKYRQSPFRKLNSDALMEIRLSKSSKPTLARKFGVSEWMIWAVRKGIRGKVSQLKPADDPILAAQVADAAFREQTLKLLKDLTR